jgi:branched-chain amino acid transport system substrate-binding protein
MMKKQNKIYLGIGIVAVVLIAAIVMFSMPKGEETIKIGATLPLSGAYSFYGESVLNAMNLAIDEINSKEEDLSIQLVVEDNKADATEAVNNVNKLMNIDNVDIIFSAFTHITQAIKTPVFNNDAILFYQSTFDEIAKEDSKTFRDYYDIGESGIKIAQAVHEDGYVNVKMLTEKSEAGDLYAEKFKEEASKYGINILSHETFISTENDFKTVLLKLDLQEDEALVVMTWRHEPIFMKQYKELNLMNIKTYHFIAPFFPSADTDELRQLYEENSAVSTWYALSEISNVDLSNEFNKKYQENYGIAPRPDAAFAYDDIYVLYNSAKNCPKDSFSDCITNNLKEISYDGVGGLLEFDEYGVANRAIILIQQINNSWVEI